jgi:hypothetical protein
MRALVTASTRTANKRRRRLHENAGSYRIELCVVRFDGRELWGENSDPTANVSLAAWEPYLEPF